ncbi:MAG: hypothetical protein Fur007_21860 [Rhodoferax sp.]
MQRMKRTPFFIAATLCVAVNSHTAAATAPEATHGVVAPAGAPQSATKDATPDPSVTPTAAIAQPATRIVIEDAQARIQELRVGSVTRSIDVHPKGGMPTYQVQPDSGRRSWKVLGF